MVSLLVNGNIPPKTTCPYRKDCLYSESKFGETLCTHKGVKHKQSFSCATARSLEMLAKYQETTKKE